LELQFLPPALTMRVRTTHGVLALFSTFPTVGAPLEITAASARGASFLVATATRALLHRELG
jgi:hypothetical protein